jgi:hypothetical protein
MSAARFAIREAMQNMSACLSGTSVLDAQCARIGWRVAADFSIADGIWNQHTAAILGKLIHSTVVRRTEVINRNWAQICA